MFPNQNGPAPTGEFFNFFPGRQYVDIVSYDNYRDLSDRYYYELLDLADGKPIALGEVGRPPAPEILKTQPGWVWFMVWAGMVDQQADGLKLAYGNPYLISRGDPLPQNSQAAEKRCCGDGVQN